MAIEILRAGADDYGSSVKILIVGDPGAGKTRHSSCWPDPLILSAEAGLMSVADRNTPNVKITESAKVREVINVLQQSPAVREQQLGVPVKTVVLDTVDEIARLLIRERLASEKKEAMAIQDWGWLGEQLRIMIRALRNLDMHVVFNVHAKSQEDSDSGRTFVKPGIQGAMGDEIAGYVDLAVLLKARPINKVVGGQNVREIVRFMQTYPDAMHTWIKDRSGRLPMEFPINFNDDFQRLDDLIFGAVRAQRVAELKADRDALAAPVPEAPAPEPTPIPDPVVEATTVEPAAEPDFVAEPSGEPSEPTVVEPEPAPEPVEVPAQEPAEVPVVEPKPAAKKAPAKKAAAAKKAAEPKAEEPVPDAGTPTMAGGRHPDGVYVTGGVESNCPKDRGCIIDKDMADLSYIRFRARLCRTCFMEKKNAK